MRSICFWRWFRVALSSVVCFLAFPPVSSNAQDVRGLRFFAYRPCLGNGSSCAERILVDGEIPPDAGQQFEAYLSLTDGLSPKPEVCFNSPGGSVDGGISLGRTIRRLQLDTCIAPNYTSEKYKPETPLQTERTVLVDRAFCASACVFAFMGGINRTVEEGSSVGVHQFAGTDSALGDDVTQVTQTRLARYLDEMGVRRTLLDVASFIPSTDIYWLSPKAAREVSLDNMTPRPAAWTLGTNAEGLLFATSGVVIPGPRSAVSVFIFARNGQPTALVSFIPGDADQAAALNALRTDDPVTLMVDGVVIGESSSASWYSRQPPFIEIEIPLQASAFDKLAEGSTLDVAASVPNAVSMYNPSIRLPLAGLAQHLPALVSRSIVDTKPVEKSEPSSSVQDRSEPNAWSSIWATVWTEWPTLARKVGAFVENLVGFALLMGILLWIASLKGRFTKPPSV
jgi:hypothetical protein